MKKISSRLILIAVFLFFIVFNTKVLIASDQAWWPSRYGKDDQLGTLNEISKLNIIEAKKVVGNGKIYELGVEYKSENPGYPPRFWETTCLAHPLRKMLGENKMTWLEEEFAGCPGKGTQIDGPAHIAVEYMPGDLRFYNGFKLSEVLTNKATLKKFDMKTTPSIVTKGILVDMVSVKGRNLKAGEKVTKSDIVNFLIKNNIRNKPGDALLINTGWLHWFWDDPKKFMSGEPGITKDVIEWAYEQHVSFIGTDQWATEVLPSEDTKEVFPVHSEALCKKGFYWGQNLDLRALAKDRIYEFMFIFAHPKIAGSTQGIGNPIAIGNGPAKNKNKWYEVKNTEKWWPSRYGENDELGTLNELHSGKVKEGIDLIRRGEVFEMGTSYEEQNPGYPPRYWHNLTLAHPLSSILGSNKMTWLEEIFIGCPGKGTQLDTPAHIGVEYSKGDIRFYNGFTLEETIGSNAKATKFGIEKTPAIVTRGILIDMVKHKGHELKKGEIVNKNDIIDYLKNKKLTLTPGDALMIRTGWMKNFYNDPEKFMSGEPGLAIDVIDWAYEKRLSFIATDQWATEVLPSENQNDVFPVHVEALCKKGFYWGQNFKMDKLAEDCNSDKKYEFMFVFTVPKITGTTQGIGNPIAIK
ncbi:hypothetical protein DSCW_05230 [Desulfosarcina widdelii]|uniref:Cyclase n=1 Tax=Desulfosarcina widdelii TaxID=947919 RepID=A0A5K7YUY0_9BACT|nr:cyclase family protein [Desulfosarcina widdelii]BBO73106.1 hypothetical protein DSCW_05230 [Desulfosarcina widdelii]